MARVLGCDPQTITNYVAKGAPVTREEGKSILIFNSAEFLEWLIHSHRRQTRGIGDRSGDDEAPRSLQEEKAREAKARADNLELKNEELRGRLVDADEVEHKWMNLVANFKTRMRGLGSKLAPIIPAKKTVAETKAFIDGHVDEALRELADDYKDD